MEILVLMISGCLVRYFVMLFLFLLVNSVARAANELESEINRAISEAGLVGVSWSVISNGQSRIGAAGFANLAEGVAMQPEQKMHVGSVTKTVLALGVLRLITEQKLSLDTNVEPLLSELNFHNLWSETSPITVKHLLEHTAGLDNIRMWQLLSDAPTPNMPLVEAFKSRDSQILRVRSKPGSQYSYSNMGYSLLGMIIEAVSKQPYEVYLDNNFLAHLGMHDSTFKFVSQNGEAADTLLAMGYFENEVAQPAISSFLRPSTQFTTTAPDMAKLMHFIVSNGSINGEAFIRKDLMAMLATPSATDAYRAGLNIGHGLALAVRDRHNVVSICHPGTTYGFRAYLCLYPEEGKGFFWAVNTDSETADYERLNKIFIQQLGIKQADVAEQAKEIDGLSDLGGVYFPSPNNMAQFELLDLVFNFIQLKPKGNELVLSPLQGANKELVPLGENLFRDKSRTQASHVIYRNQADEILLSDGLNTFKKGGGALIIFYWLSLFLGLVGFLYIGLTGFIRIALKRKPEFYRIGLAFFNLVLFSVPIYLYTQQSFLKFGDLTSASASLALLSGLLPISLVVSAYICFKSKANELTVKVDIIALLLSLQLCILLVIWGQLPIVFWR